MRRSRQTIGLGFTLLLLAVTASLASAAPNPNSAVVVPRIFNDCPGSTLSITNNYPTCIIIDDQNVGCVGFANLHAWRFSEDGANPRVFNNGDSFRFAADVTISGTGNAEAGLQIAPWWSQADGRLNVRTSDGEIACFGGRLPFYSFTATDGLHYVKGETVHLEIVYHANGLSEASPGTIEYKVTIDGVEHSSGVKAFDEGNPAEDPPYGLWGILNEARVGGHFQFFVNDSGPDGQSVVQWCNIEFEALPLAVHPRTWGSVKSLFR
jgi:hypothetical protein